MKKVVGLGNALVDLLIRLEDDAFLEVHNLDKGSMQLVDYERVHELMDHLGSQNMNMIAGGSAANTIHGLANLGIPCGLIGKVGADELGKAYADDLKKNSIETHLLPSDSPSGRALTLISKDSERTFATYLGAALELSAEDISEDILKQYDLLHIEGYLVQNQLLLEGALKCAKQQGLKVSLDLASFNVVEDNLDFLKNMVASYVDIVFANEEEAHTFTGYKDPEKALVSIFNMSEIAVVKLGKKGACAMWGKEKAFAPALTGRKGIDTTGAGDLFASGFLYGMLKDKGIEECLRLGNLLGGHVISFIGPKLDEETWETIKTQV